MEKLVLASASWCSPCKTVKEQIEQMNVRVEIKDFDSEPDFFNSNSIKSVPQLFVYDENDNLIDNVRGPEQILNRIKKTF